MGIKSKFYIPNKIVYDLMSLMNMDIKTSISKNKRYTSYDRKIAFNRWNKQLIYIKNYLL